MPNVIQFLFAILVVPHVHVHEALPKLAVVRNAGMEQFMHDHVVLKFLIQFQQ
jgi:hypothetical protein